MVKGRERLRQWIDRSKVNQLEAAEIIDIDPTQLSHILTGRRRPGLDTAVKIERATGIAVEAWTPIDDGEAEPIDPTLSANVQIDKA
jgi:plasmid maintenance system antidote protein VapI